MDTTIFFDLTKRGKWEILETEWLKFVADPAPDPKFYSRLISGMRKRGAEERCDQMIALLVQTMTENGRATDALKIARHCMKQLDKTDALCEAVIGSLKARYGDRPNFEAFMKVSGLREGADLNKAFTRFLTFANFDVGEAYTHKTWGVGAVTAIDPEEKTVVLRFPDKEDAPFTMAGAREYLTRLPRAHVLARMAREPERMKELADDKPAEFVKLALKSFKEDIKVSFLKLEMVAYLMSDAEWKRWWNRSRDHIRVDPWIRFAGSGLNATLSLRDKPKSVHDQNFEALQEGATPRQRMDAARRFVRTHQRSPITPDELARVEGWLVDEFHKTSDDARRVEIHFLLAALRKIGEDHVEPPTPGMEGIVRQSADPLTMLQRLAVFEYQSPVLDMIRAERADWLTVYEESLPELGARLAQRGMKALREGEHLESLRHASEGMLTDPSRNLDVWLWAATEYINGRWDAFAPKLSVEMMMQHLLEHFAHLVNVYVPRDDGADSIRSQMLAIRRFLVDKQHVNARKVVSLLSPEGARRFYEHLQAHPGMDSSEKAHLAGALRAERPELEERAQENLLTSAYHYATRESYDRQMERLRHIRSVEIPANSERIGRAAAMGDLSENAEYDAAKEEQARLTSMSSELEDRLRYARIMEPATVRTDEALPGTRVRVRYNDGAEETYSLLGVWEANPDKHILSYLSPLGSQFLHKKVGDQFEVNLPSGESRLCHIVSIENALAPASGEATAPNETAQGPPSEPAAPPAQ